MYLIEYSEYYLYSICVFIVFTERIARNQYYLLNSEKSLVMGTKLLEGY